MQVKNRPTVVKYAARIKPEDVLVFEYKDKPHTLRVGKVERARGRKPAKGETLILHVGKKYPLRINSTTPVRVLAPPTEMSATP